jgi:hypothetical protein
LKQKIFGLSLVAFIFLWLFLWYKPKTGIDPNIKKADRIDSVVITKFQQNFTVTSRKDISSISTILTNAAVVKKMDRENINTDAYSMNFYTKGNEQPEEIRVLFNYYHGIVINTNGIYYRGDSLNEKVKGIIHN